jgi:mRNA interferase MazF
MRTINQRDIILCDFGDGVGSEQKQTRPALIVSNNLNNAFSDTIIVCPITSKRKKELPTHYTLTKDKYDFFDLDSNTVLCEQIRCVSRSRLGMMLGSIDLDDWNGVLERIKINFSQIELFS